MANLNTYGLNDLVRDPSFDFLNKLGPNDPETEHNHDFLSTDLSDSPYFNSAFHTKYFDTLQFTEKFHNNKKLALMSLNIQSLPAKYESLKELLSELSIKKLHSWCKLFAGNLECYRQ
jgi:hypothetical protein